VRQGKNLVVQFFAAGNTVNKTIRGARADARARPEKEKTAAPQGQDYIKLIKILLRESNDGPRRRAEGEGTALPWSILPAGMNEVEAY